MSMDSPAYAGDTREPAPLSPLERKKLRRTRLIYGLVCVLILAGAIGSNVIMGALKPEPEETEDEIKAIPVLTAMAVQDDVTLSVNVQGEVQPRTQINLVPQVGGRITYMSPRFIEGGAFAKGELLVRIDPEEYRLRVIQAQSQVAQAETSVTRERSEGAIARRDWEELGRAGEPTALTLREPQLAQARAELESAKARLAEAELQLARTELRAPFDGRVTDRHVDGGEFVSPGTRLGEIYSVDVMDVRLPLTNSELARAGLSLGYTASANDPGIPVTLSANVAGRFSQWEGRIVRTDSRFDSRSRVLYAYVEVQDPFGAGADDGVPLAPGLFVDAAVSGESKTNVIMIPRSALRGNDKVYTIGDDGTLSIEAVEVISSDRNRAILSTGLSRGTAVITSPIRGAADGMRIDVVESLEPEASNPTTEETSP